MCMEGEKIIDLGMEWRLWVLCDREPTEDGSMEGSRCSAMPPIRCCNIRAGRVHGDGGCGMPVAYGGPHPDG